MRMCTECDLMFNEDKFSCGECGSVLTNAKRPTIEWLHIPKVGGR